MPQATTAQVMEGKLFINDNTVYVGTRKEVIEDIFCSNVTTSGTTRTVNGSIICCGLRSNYGSASLDFFSGFSYTPGGNSFSFRCNNSAYRVSCYIRVLYVPNS